MLSILIYRPLGVGTRMFDTRSALALVLTGVLVSGSVVGVASAQSSELVTVTVTVVDGDDDSLGDIDLTATWEADGGGSTNETTRSNGQALVDVPRGADVEITVHDDEYVRNTPFVVEDAGEESVTVPVTAGGTATLEVVDSGGGVPSPAVQLYRDGTYVVNTRGNASGLYTTPMIEQGTYSLTVSKNGYLRNRTALTVDENTTRRIELEQASRLVTFTITDDHFDEPRTLAGATITVAGNTITTLSTGEATIRLPVNTNYDVEVTRDGYETVTRTLSVRERQVERNISIQRADSLSIEPDNTQVVVGQSVEIAVSDEYGDAVENATLSVGNQTVGQTDESGEAVVPVDTVGQNRIRVNLDGLSANTTVEGVPESTDTPTATATATETTTATATATETDTPTATTTNATTTAQTTTEPTSLTGPGFTGLGALVAGLLAIALLVRRD